MCIIIHIHNIRSFGPDLIIVFGPSVYEFNIFALTYRSKSLVLLLCFGVKPLFLLCLIVCVLSVRVHESVRAHADVYVAVCLLCCAVLLLGFFLYCIVTCDCCAVLRVMWCVCCVVFCCDVREWLGVMSDVCLSDWAWLLLWRLRLGLLSDACACLDVASDVRWCLGVGGSVLECLGVISVLVWMLGLAEWCMCVLGTLWAMSTWLFGCGGFCTWVLGIVEWCAWVLGRG